MTICAIRHNVIDLHVFMCEKSSDTHKMKVWYVQYGIHYGKITYVRGKKGGAYLSSWMRLWLAQEVWQKDSKVKGILCYIEFKANLNYMRHCLKA